MASVLFPLFLPYYRLEKEWYFNRGVVGVSKNSATPLDYLNPASTANKWECSLLQFAEIGRQSMLFPGFLALILLLLSILLSNRLLDSRLVKINRACLVLTLVSLIFSLGPYLQLTSGQKVPLPYIFIHRFPGFEGLRGVYRFGFLAFLAVSICGTFGFLKLVALVSQRFPRRYVTLSFSVFFLFFLVFEISDVKIPSEKVATGKDVPQVYRWLATQEYGPVIEFPTGCRYIDDLDQYFSVYHFRPLISSGGTSFYPPTSFEILTQVQDFPSPVSIRFLRSIRVKWVVIHRDSLTPAEKKRINTIPSLASAGIVKVAEFGKDVVFSLKPIQTVSRLIVNASIPASLPIAERPMIALKLNPAGNKNWAHPVPFGYTPIHFEWANENGKIVSSETTSFRFPLIIESQKQFLIATALTTPKKIGNYRLKIKIPYSNDFYSGIIRLIKFTPSRMEVPLAKISIAHSIKPVSNGWLLIPLTITNTTSYPMASQDSSLLNPVYFFWYWDAPNSPCSSIRGIEPLVWDMWPRQTYVFSPIIFTPSQSGTHVLNLA